MSKVTTTLYGDLALLPLEALAVTKEVLEWSTDLFISNDGTEDAQKLRANARQKIYYKFFENHEDKVPGFITEYGAYTELWSVPLWMERQYLGVISSGGTTLLCVTDIYAFQDSSLALLYESPTSWQVIEINTVGGTQLNLLTALESFNQAYLMPIRICTIINKINRSSNGYNINSDLGFEVIDVLDTVEIVPDQYLSDDYYGGTLFKDSDRYSSIISNNMQKVDFTLGKILKRFPFTNNRIARPFYNLFETQQEVFDFRRYLTRRCGRYRPYWGPTFEIDLVNNDVSFITDVLYIVSDGFLDWDKQRENIAIFTKAGVWLLRAIINTAQITPTSVALNLDSALNISPDDIDTISFLGFHRFNTDVIELNWSKGGTVMETKINTIEVSP